MKLFPPGYVIYYYKHLASKNHNLDMYFGICSVMDYSVRTPEIQKLQVPDKILDKLRCFLCKEYLTQLPVYIYPSKGGAACGRCSVINEETHIRNTTYETLASYLRFPCRFRARGCSSNELLYDMKAHEETCAYQLYFCPFIPLASCTWQGSLKELCSHYEESHYGLSLHEPTFEIDWNNTPENNYLLKINDDIFIIHIRCDLEDNVFWCSIRYIGGAVPKNQLTYQIRLKEKYSDGCVTSTKKYIADYTSVSLNESTDVHLNLNWITNALRRPHFVSCRINITPCDVTTPDSIKLSRQIVYYPDYSKPEIFLELHCPACKEFMSPPIYQCSTVTEFVNIANPKAIVRHAV
ncbi:hypothetical protein FQR65_LT09751 [Abscondita terminalis]|nr:hypothetical protein FQR65_LT09751 [Abscondita terminalis]